MWNGKSSEEFSTEEQIELIYINMVSGAYFKRLVQVIKPALQLGSPNILSMMQPWQGPQVGRKGGCENELDPACILKVELARFANE